MRQEARKEVQPNILESFRFLRSTKEQGGEDPIFDKLEELRFPILEVSKWKSENQVRSRPSSPVRDQGASTSHSAYQVLALHGITPPPTISFPPYNSRVIMAAPCAIVT